MSDVKLRAVERRWQATGSVDDEATYLLQRARAGDLDSDLLDLAAYCGHPAAGRARPAAALSTRSTWFSGLSRWGEETELRAAVLAVEAALEVDPEPMLEAEAVLEAVRAWQGCPCEAHAREAHDAGLAAVAAVNQRSGSAYTFERARVLRAAGLVGLALARARHAWLRVVSTGTLASWCGVALTELASLRPQAERAARERLASWALGGCV